MCQSCSKSQLFPCYTAFLQVNFMFLADLSLSRGCDQTPWRSSASLVMDQSQCTKAEITDNLLNGLDRIEVKIDFSSSEPLMI